MRLFSDRREAGQRLALRLTSLRAEQPVVVGLPRGGVPVAAEVARELNAPLDVIVVRKLGVPYQPELAMGALGEDGIRVLNEDVLRASRVREFAGVEARERGEVERLARRLRGSKPMTHLNGRTVILVDDGIATGSTARAALQVARAHGAARVILAVPVAPSDTMRELSTEADAIVVLKTPQAFRGVGQWYEDFSQVSDQEVRTLLASAASAVPPTACQRDGLPAPVREVAFPVDGADLPGQLVVPAEPVGLVVFAHGSGSSRTSPRNRQVAKALQACGLATLLFDLLIASEERERANVFDVALLGGRLVSVTDQLGELPEIASLPIGFFGASTGAAAALWAAAEPTSPVQAIVSRGGRPDLAGPRLSKVLAPTLLIVGGADNLVLDLNRQAARQLSCEHHLAEVPDATHLFEESGALDAVADLARQWFVSHLMRSARFIA